MSDTSRWIIVSNRLPFKLSDEGALSPSSGGLVTAVKGIEFETPALWVGAAPVGLTPERWEALSQRVPDEDPAQPCYEPIFLEDDLYDAYYNGLCNDVLWPLLHYEPRYVRFTREAWQAYQEVNERFAEAIDRVAQDGDLVWIHDFHFFLLPALLRQRRPELRTGFFLHVPFPSSEIFRQLPVREQLLRSLLDANLVGFHDYDYLRHFCAALRGLLGIDSNLLSVPPDEGRDHTTQLGVFPVGINTEHFRRTATSEEVQNIYRRYARNLQVDRLILGVDRLDYMKGIDLKLDAFQAMLEAHPEWRGRARLLQIAVPSRMEVPEYVRLRERIERRVGEINGRFGSPEFVPVHYMFSTVSFEELIALYRLADVLLVTSKRDGMNLVAQEYVVTQPTEDPGVLVLSEFAGASSVLSHALRINPWNVDDTAAQLHRALTMPLPERIERHRPMLAWLEGYTASAWAGAFIRALETVPPSEAPISVRDALSMREVLQRELHGRPVLLLLDYDGTLVPIREVPEAAVLDAPTRARLLELCALPDVEVIVVSGRDRDFLSRQLEGLPVGIACEHGAVFRPVGADPDGWQTLVHNNNDGWRAITLQLLEDFSACTPDSFVERKHFGLAWHYRSSPRRFAEHQARRLIQELGYALSNQPVTILDGNKVIEVRAMEANKGNFLRWLLGSAQHDYADHRVIALGDDATDEDMFAVLDDDALTIRVGVASTAARYRIERQVDVLPLLADVLGATPVADRGGPADRAGHPTPGAQVGEAGGA